MMKIIRILNLTVETFWRCLIVTIVLHTLATEGITDTIKIIGWIGIYWIMIPTIKYAKDVWNEKGEENA